jgi:hypothetical protein
MSIQETMTTRRRFRRFLGRAALALSLLFTIFTALAWVDSHRERSLPITMAVNVIGYREPLPPQELHRQLSGWRWTYLGSLDSTNGGFPYMWRVKTQLGDLNVRYETALLPGMYFPRTIHHSVCGFQFDQTTAKESRSSYSSRFYHVREVTLPFWVLVSLFALCPLLFVAYRARERSQARRCAKAGHCPSCNYNLTGNTSGICPECGIAIEKGTKQTVP